MALDAVVSVIYQKLGDVVAEESITRNKVIGTQLKEMQDALEKMQGFFIDAADKETNVEAIKKWTDDYLPLLYSLEDTIESFALRITRQRKRMGFLMTHALFLNFTACKKLSRKLKKIQRKIDVLNAKKSNDVENASLRSNRSLQNYKQNDSSSAVNLSTYDYADHSISASSITNGSSPKRRSYSGVTTNTHDYADHSISISSITKGTSPRRRSFSGVTKFSRENSILLLRERFKQEKLNHRFSGKRELYIVGFKQDLHNLVKRLTNGNDRNISLVGKLGSGKTTLARAVYGNRAIKDHFKSLCAWITISKDSSTEDLLLNLLKQVGESKDQDGGLTELQNRVQGRLKDQKYLIVLDGVWSFEVWKNLENAFPDQKNGSKIILSTYPELVATGAFSESSALYMKKLDAQDSWELFLHTVGSEESDELSTLKTKTTQICDGLPLNIVLLGSLLSTKEDKEWASILDRQENCCAEAN